MREDKYIMGVEQKGERIDFCLSELYQDVSRSFIKKLIKEDLVKVNSQDIKPSYIVKENDEVVISFPEEKKTEILPEDIDIDVVYEDDDIIIVNKPKGMIVHPAPGVYSGTLVNALLFRYGRENLSDCNGDLRPGIVHRIDKDTSGILAVCKNNRTHESLSKLFQTHDITREYRTICYSSFKQDEIDVDRPIGRNPKDRLKMAVVKGGKRAVTHFKAIENFNGFSYVSATLETGRTHQIRVHLASLSHPVLGDFIYGPSKNRFGIKGQLLHARLLGFIHPSTGEYVEFESDLPDEFKEVLRKLRGGSRNGNQG